MGQANRRGNRETRKALAVIRNENAKAERTKHRRALWDALTLEERVRYRDAEEWLLVAYTMTEPYRDLLRKLK